VASLIGNAPVGATVAQDTRSRKRYGNPSSSVTVRPGRDVTRSWTTLHGSWLQCHALGVAWWSSVTTIATRCICVWTR